MTRAPTEPGDALHALPDTQVNVREAFGIDSGLAVPAFARRGPHVPAVDPAYRFERNTTLAILAGFSRNRRVLVQGRHGTGKSSHIEQVAARLNWPCVRINLDGHIGRLELVGRDAIAVRDGHQVTEFQEGMLPWALQRGVALVFDEYDAGRPEILFVLQRVLEVDGALTLLDRNRVITPHPAFRLFATANTVGLGDAGGLYHGTQLINQGQLDRWHIVATLDYLPAQAEIDIVLARVPGLNDAAGRETVRRMVALAGLTRAAFAAGEISTLMSPRTVIAWAENALLFGFGPEAFGFSFLNRCDAAERAIVAELYQRCFAEEAPGPR